MEKILKKLIKNNIVESKNEKGHYLSVSEICAESSTPIKIGNDWMSLEDFKNNFSLPNDNSYNFVIKNTLNKKFYMFGKFGDLEDFDKKNGYYMTRFCNMATRYKSFKSAKKSAQEHLLDSKEYVIEEIE